MFQDACDKMLDTLLPIVIAWRQNDGKTGCGIGAGLIVNEDGWFITADHILAQISELDRQSKSYSRRKDSISHYTVIFGTTKATGISVLAPAEPDIDLGCACLQSFQFPEKQEFARFRDGDVRVGEMLCRAGYPFVDNLVPSWSENEGFTFDNLFPIPMFVNEAFVSRYVALASGRLIETSTPGLKGQSGGPVVDVHGHVCGMQVNTIHYPLGFKGAGRNQVLNVGRAVHVETIRDILYREKIKFYTGEE